MNRIHDYCTSLAVSAMLTSAFLATAPEGFMAASAGPMGASAALESAMAGLRADGWHGATGIALPTTTAAVQTQPAKDQASPSSSPFTEIQLQKLNQYWDTRAKGFEIFPRYSRLLGLTKGDEVIKTRKISGKDEKNIRHLFSRLNNGAGYYLTRATTPDETHAYWAGLDFKLIAAISISKDNGTTVLAVSDAEKELSVEYSEWAKIADEL